MTGTSATAAAIHTLVSRIALPVVYAFEYTDCEPEGVPAAVSIHASKRGAWKAMREHKWAQEVQEREDYLRYGYGTSRAAVSLRRWRIRRIVVQP